MRISTCGIMISSKDERKDRITTFFIFDFSSRRRDSIIEDKETERSRDRQDVSMGVMSLVEYRAKWYGESEEDAAKNLPEQNQVME